MKVLWNKKVTKLKKIMFKIKKFIMNIKTYKACKIQIRIPSITSANFSNSYILTFSPISLNVFLSLTTSLPELINCLIILDLKVTSATKR